MKIKYKLPSSFIIMIALMIAIAGTSYLHINRTIDATDETLQDGDYKNDLRMLQYRLVGMSNDERAYLLNGDRAFRDQITEKEKDIADIFARIDANMSLDDTDRQLLSQIRSQFEAYAASSATVMKQIDSGNQAAALKAHFGDERTARKQLDLIVADAVKKLELEMQTDRQDRKTDSDRQALIMLAIFVGAIVVAFMISLLLTASITRPIRSINRQLQAIAEGNGDLSHDLEIRSKDEIGQLAESFNRMASKLRAILSQAMDTAVQVASSSQQLSASAEQTTRATEHIVVTTQQIAANAETEQRHMEEASQAIGGMFAGIEQVSGYNEQVRISARSAKEASSIGAEAANDVLQAMEEMQATVEQTSSVVLSLGNRSQQIDSITGMITEVATRTNLLALNASIEASRAGEHGRGFAVVAQEIRKLAEQSGQSAQQIGDLIQEVVRETGQAVSSMNAVAGRTQQGLRKTEQLNDLFREIEEHVAEVDGEATQAASTTAELAASSRQIVQMAEAVSNVSHEVAAACQHNSASTEEQLATMEEIASYSDTLARMAEELRETLSRFKLQ